MLQGIPSVMTARGTGGSSLLSGLQVYYALSDVTDSSGNGLTLTNNNAVTFSAGKVGNAANFVAASNQNLERADNAKFQPGTGDWTYAAWVNYTSAGFVAFLTYGAPQNTQPGYELFASGGELFARVSDGSGNVFSRKGAGQNSNDGLWHLVIVTMDRAGNQTMYVDNDAGHTVSMATVTGSIADNGSYPRLSLGSDVNGDYNTFSEDEAGMWNRVLTSTEISTNLWNGGSGTTWPF